MTVRLTTTRAAKWAAAALGLMALPAMAMAQDATDSLRAVGIDCNAPGSFCRGSTTTTTSGPDGESTSTESWRTVNGQPANQPADSNQPRVIQPRRDDSPMPGMRFDPALGYYVPITPAPAPTTAGANGEPPVQRSKGIRGVVKVDPAPAASVGPAAPATSPAPPAKPDVAACDRECRERLGLTNPLR